MIERIRNGWGLVRASWDVVRADRELLLLPVMSGAASLGVLALTFFGVFGDELGVVRDGGPLASPTPFEWMLIAIATYALSYIAIFFNVAIVCAADERMSGGDPTLGSALADARRHAGAIAPWALISVVVSTILKAIEERGGIAGRIVAGLLGVAWALVTYLVLPVLVLEGVGVREAISRSKDLFVRTWGESVSGEIGLSLVGFLAVLPVVPVLLLVAGGGRPEMIIAAIVLGVAWCLLVAVVMSALTNVFRVALYRFAVDGEAPEGFGDVDFHGVFPPKRRRRFLG
jgi:hypothetical protein